MSSAKLKRSMRTVMIPEIFEADTPIKIERSLQDARSPLRKRPTQQGSLSESEDQYSLSDSNAVASSASGPNIVLHQAESDNQSSKLSQATSYLSNTPEASEDLSPRGRESFGLEELSVDNADPIDPIHRSFIPPTITYSLHSSLRSVQEVSGCAFIDQTLPFDGARTYQDIESKARDYIRSHHGEILAARELYFRIGKCTIFDESGYKDTHLLTSQDDWNEICLVLIDLWNKKGRTPRLKISQDYFGLQTQVVSGEPFANSLRNEIHNLMKQASDGKWYIPCAELNIITSNPMIRRIVLEDAHLDMTLDEKDLFIRKVQRDARRLLVMCVDASLGMSCLKELLDKGLTDAKLPFGKISPCHSQCKVNLRSLISMQGSFMAAEFLDIGQHQNFFPQTVVPIHYKKVKTQDNHPAEEKNEHFPTSEKKASDTNSTSSFDDNDDGHAKKMACCGRGAYSNVYRVKIDSDHHRLSKDRDSDFAVKEFKDRPSRGDADFKKELRILDMLRNYPHKHIVTHLATWTHDERYYMLFPYAESNLRQYMRSVSFGGPRKKTILWLLAQFCGLASAIHKIHDLSSAEKSSTSGTTSNLAIPPVHPERKSGWHHDLKPENILYFSSKSSKLGTLRIADFGSGKIHTYRSGSINTRSPNGTLTYEPPEAKSEGATSRPSDIWSLGCVFQELLIWAVFDFNSVESFRNGRIGRRFPDSMIDIVADDGFWQIFVDGTVCLRKSVNEWIELLRKDLGQPKWRPFMAFEKVLDLVIRMLDPDPRRRISALDLWDTLYRIDRQTKLDLKRTNGNRDTPLPQLSLKAPDRRSPEPPLNTFAFPLNTQVAGPVNRQVGSIIDGALTFSPIHSPLVSRATHPRNNFASKP
ncbi:hypothetical protein MMC22_003797 [Lobaria immixta]|nr:hypothetical protein [Lobaria immixta]